MSVVAYYFAWKFPPGKSGRPFAELRVQYDDHSWETLVHLPLAGMEDWASRNSESRTTMAASMFEHHAGRTIDPEDIDRFLQQPGIGLRFEPSDLDAFLARTVAVALF